MIDISIMIEGQFGLTWPCWKKLVSEVEGFEPGNVQTRLARFWVHPLTKPFSILQQKNITSLALPTCVSNKLKLLRPPECRN